MGGHGERPSLSCWSRLSGRTRTSWRRVRMSPVSSTTFGTEVRLSERFLSATGAIGLLAVVLRIIVNVAGTFQVLPLAGVPIAFLAHAPAATNFALAYAGILLGAASGRRSGITETAP